MDPPWRWRWLGWGSSDKVEVSLVLLVTFRAVRLGRGITLRAVPFGGGVTFEFRAGTAGAFAVRTTLLRRAAESTLGGAVWSTGAAEPARAAFTTTHATALHHFAHPTHAFHELGA